MKTYKFHPSVIPVKGINRSLLCDLDRREYIFVPNALYSIIIDNPTGIIEDVVEHYAEGDVEIKTIIEDYFRLLEEKEYLFHTSNPELYQEISLEWDYPASVSNAIIEVDYVDLNYLDILNQLSNLGCNGLVIRYFRTDTLANLEQILDWTLSCSILSVEIIVQNSLIEEVSAINLVEKYPNIKYIIVSNYHENKAIKSGGPNNMGHIWGTQESVISALACGHISDFYFMTTIQTFTESQHHNTCLNRKISIDKDGYIKNCPSMSQHFGHINDTKLETVLNNPEFTKYWHIKKDLIKTCQDCEFRHVCTDCRAYTEDPDDLYAKPLKCGYNPYTSEWEDWSTHPMKQMAIDTYGLRDFMTPQP